MIDKVKQFMSSKYSYDLSEYGVYQTEFKKSRLYPITLSIFAVILLIYIFSFFMAWAEFMSLWLFLGLFILLVIAPLGVRKTSKYDAIIVTPEYLIQRVSKMEFVAIKYVDIKSYKMTKEGIKIRDGRNLIVLSVNMFREEVDPIVEILEAKGKTFDKSKEYMIRPIEIRIVDNKINLVDIEVETELDMLYARCSKDFNMLTPGYLKDIIFRNATVEDCLYDEEGNNLSVHFNRFEVKAGHPENTTFESIIAMDCVVIFHDVKVTQFVIQDLHDRKKPEVKLPHDPKEVPDHLDNAIVSEWKTTKRKFEVLLSEGINLVKLSISFKEVLVGWNSIKQ